MKIVLVRDDDLAEALALPGAAEVTELVADAKLIYCVKVDAPPGLPMESQRFQAWTLAVRSALNSMGASDATVFVMQRGDSIESLTREQLERILERKRATR